MLGLPALPAAADEAPVGVTVVTRAVDGGLAFRTERVARSSARSHALRWRHRTGVLAADVDHRVRVAGDPLRADQWGLTALRASEVQPAGGARGQVVAVVDSGVDATHPDLAGVVLAGTDLVSGGDGRTDPNGHGTHVAGVAAAVADNGTGGAGLAGGASVLPVRVIGADGSGTDSDAARGVVWAADHGATVINLSFGGPDRSRVMDAAVAYALERGVPVVAAAGNEGLAGDPVLYPAATAGVIAVSAVDRAGVRPGWSSTGGHLALSAPGVGILSTVPGGGYASWSGTSMATPFVTATVALLRHAQPGLSPSAVRDRLMSTADDLGPVGPDPQYGAGQVDPYRALGLAAAPAPEAPAASALVASEPTPSPAAEPPAATADPVLAAPEPSASPRTPEVPAAPPAPSVQQPTPAAPALPPTASPSAPQGPPPLVGVRMSSSRTVVAYRAPVVVAARALVPGGVAAGTAVRLERLVAGRWVLTRTGTTGRDGLVSWTLRPDATTAYRVRAATVTSALRTIAVRRPA